MVKRKRSDSPKSIMVLGEHAEGKDDAGMAVGSDCAKCQFQHHKDYKHVCARAYGRGLTLWSWTNRMASPGDATQPESTAAPRHWLHW